MTDKQIIIDGVDVSGCGYIDQDSAWCDLCMTNCAKETKPCYYKQLKRKEQEFEELKKQHQADKGLITTTGKMNYQLLQEYDKLKTALTEIKEIAENGKRFAERYMITGEQKANVLTYANAILQKISEVVE